jgi:hypothetical protein
MKTIDVAKDFSQYPAGRSIGDGPFTGEALAHRVHLALATEAEVELILDGAAGYGASFISGFAVGLHTRGWLPAVLETRLRLTTADPLLKREFWTELMGSQAPSPPAPPGEKT